MILSTKENNCDLDQAVRLDRLVGQMRSAKSLDTLFEDLQEPLLALLDSDRITIYIIDRDGKVIKSVRKTGNIPSQIRVPMDKNSVAGFVATTGSAISIANAYNYVELMTISPDLKFDGSWDRLSGYHTRQILAAPISSGGKTVGIIQVINKSGGSRFTPSDRKIINKICDALGATLKRIGQEH